jgi:predicted NACHT family NTPase
MQDAYDLLGKILAVFKLPLTWWTVTLFIILYFLRDRLTRGINSLLDWLGRNVATRIGSRRFEPKYKSLIRANHLHLKIVGIRTEEEHRPKIADAYVPLTLLQQGDTIDHAISVDQMLRVQSYNLILGDPGAGKSTILDYTIVQVTEPASKQKARARATLTPVGIAKRKSRTPCPIYVPLRRCSMEHRTLLEDILDETTEILPLPIRQAMPKKFIEHCLKKGNALLLLDGLDEVMHEKAYDAAIRKINEFTQLYPDVNVVVTCRKAGWRGGLNPDFSIYSLLSLDAQQLHNFVHKWYPSVLLYVAHGTATSQQEILRRAEREANNLLTLLRIRERLQELASNPLILSLICLVHKQRKDLPRGRTALYQDCLDILLELWDREDKDYDQTYPTTDQKKHLLRCVAYRMHSNGMREVDRRTLGNWVVEFLPGIQDNITPTETVRQIEVRSGIMAERAINLLTFSHLTF